jgi:hypothetical protein
MHLGAEGGVGRHGHEAETADHPVVNTRPRRQRQE